MTLPSTLIVLSPNHFLFYSYLPNPLNSDTISPRVSWNGMEPFLCSGVTVDSGPIESPENRIFKAVPIPVIWIQKHGSIGLDTVA